MGKGLLSVLYQLKIVSYLAAFLYYLSYSLSNNSTWCLGLDFQPRQNYLTQVWTNLALFSGIFLFHLIVTVGMTRLLTLKIVPYVGEQPRITLVFNRIITNTIEQLVVFACLLFAATHTNLLNWSEAHYAQLTRIFILARCFFAVGYVLAQLLSIPPLRSFGVAWNFFVSGTIVLGYFGVDMFALSKGLPALEL